VPLPDYLRPSIGTAGVLGLKQVKMLVKPSTAYIMVGERCESNCLFCSQRRDGRKKDMLSRVVWPKFPSKTVISALRKSRDFSRICFQTLDYKGVVEDTIAIMGELGTEIPVSVSMVPVGERDMERLRDEGVEYLSIALDAANEEIFDKVKGKGVGNRFTWEGHWKALNKTVEIFGKGNTHLIVGLGERDEDLIKIMIRLKDMGVYTALFAYTPVNGGNPPDMGRYRAIQLSHSLIYRHKVREFYFENGRLKGFNAPEEVVKKASKYAFMTSGCPGCNRPFYNERPGKELYNYPYVPDEKVIKRSLETALEYLSGD